MWHKLNGTKKGIIIICFIGMILTLTTATLYIRQLVKTQNHTHYSQK